MSGDPYERLLAAMGRGNGPAPGPFLPGKVLQCGNGKPLKVSAAGLPALEGDDLFVSQHLNWTWMEDTGGAELLRAGDRVALLSDDMQTYYLMCKVVSAGG